MLFLILKVHGCLIKMINRDFWRKMQGIGWPEKRNKEILREVSEQ